MYRGSLCLSKRLHFLKGLHISLKMKDPPQNFNTTSAETKTSKEMTNLLRHLGYFKLQCLCSGILAPHSIQSRHGQDLSIIKYISLLISLLQHGAQDEIVCRLECGHVIDHGSEISDKMLIKILLISCLVGYGNYIITLIEAALKN